MGLIYKTSEWSDLLWNDHIAQSTTAQQLIRDGMNRQGEFPEFANDVHAALYLRHQPPFEDNAPQWANELLNQAQAIPEYKTLKAKCNNDGFAAGIATETLLDAIKAHIPKEDKKHDSSNPMASSGDNSQMRQDIRQALRSARDAVTEAEQTLEPLMNAAGITHGSQPGEHETLEDVEQMRQAYHVLKGQSALNDITRLAGRMKRLTANKQRSTVKKGVGPIKGLTQGGDVSRLIPASIAGLRHRAQRLDTLRKIINRQALQYKMDAKQTLGRGPIVICRDMSSSMRGMPDTWAKAVCLALMETAQEQKRQYTQIAYETYITQEVSIEPTKTSLESILPILTQAPAGGTDFNPPLARALDIIKDAPTMRQADVIFITDGHATIEGEIIEAYQDAQRADGLSVYVVSVGRSPATILDPIATESYHVKPTQAGGIEISAALALEER